MAGSDVIGRDTETRTDDEWRRALTPEQYRVLREHGTERAGTSCLNAEKRAGTFFCAGCGARSSRAAPSMSPAAAGRASSRRWKARWRRRWTAATG